MKNQANYHFTANKPGELKFSKIKIFFSKKPRYIYTEADLGDGILDVGVSA